jgi:hypothetical protein
VILLSVLLACGQADAPAEDPTTPSDAPVEGPIGQELGSLEPPPAPPPKPEAVGGVDLSAQPVTTGALAPALIKASGARKADALAACVTTDAQGQLEVRFVIAADGKVSSAEIASTTIAHPETEACMVEVFQGTQFAQPVGGGDETVTWLIQVNR